MNSTPENVRHHAAGHLAAAALLVEGGHQEAAKLVMRAIESYVQHPQVQAPPQLINKVIEAAADPKEHLADIVLLEEWFVHPLNTTIETHAA